MASDPQSPIPHRWCPWPGGCRREGVCIDAWACSVSPEEPGENSLTDAMDALAAEHQLMSDRITIGVLAVTNGRTGQSIRNHQAPFSGWFQGAVPGIIAALETCADDLEGEVNARYPEPIHPSQAGRQRRDLEPVVEARRMARLLRERIYLGDLAPDNSSADGQPMGNCSLLCAIAGEKIQEGSE